MRRSHPAGPGPAGTSGRGSRTGNPWWWLILVPALSGCAAIRPPTESWTPIEGRVIDEAGRPIENVVVTITPLNRREAGRGLECVTATRQAGLYRCRALGDSPFREKRRYRVRLERPPLFEEVVFELTYQAGLEPLETVLPTRFEAPHTAPVEEPASGSRSSSRPPPELFH